MAMSARKVLSAAVACMAVATATGVSAQNADHYRGGWRTDAGAPHVYQFVIRGTKVSGAYCTHCADGTTLAPIDGTFDEKTGLTFRIRHLKLNGTLDREDRLQARLQDGKLIITGQQGGARGAAINQTTIKDPRGPTPGPTPQAILPPGSPPVPVIRPAAPAAGGSAPARPPAYVQPAAWRQISARDVIGVWLGFGVGMEKQYFIIRKDGERLFGIACGRCDNPYTFGALENFKISGELLEFDIAHQDWGDGDIIPFDRHVKATITMNEMRMDARRPDQADRPGIVASLVGPIAIEATAGNIVGK
jgi:hypothetical protein